MQTGELYSALLHLHNMARLTFGQLDENARIFITDWLEKNGPEPIAIANGRRGSRNITSGRVYWLW